MHLTGANREPAVKLPPAPGQMPSRTAVGAGHRLALATGGKLQLRPPSPAPATTRPAPAPGRKLELVLPSRAEATDGLSLERDLALHRLLPGDVALRSCVELVDGDRTVLAIGEGLPPDHLQEAAADVDPCRLAPFQQAVRPHQRCVVRVGRRPGLRVDASEGPPLLVLE